jgi:hypothetical protein
VGSTSAYTTRTKVLFTNATLAPTDELSFFTEIVYTLSEGSFHPFHLPEPEDQPSNWDNDFSNVQDYSDLDYTQLTATYGGSFAFSDQARVYGSLTFMDLVDSAPYVYGDLSGTLILYAAGMTVDF